MVASFARIALESTGGYCPSELRIRYMAAIICSMGEERPPGNLPEILRAIHKKGFAKDYRVFFRRSR